MQDCGSVVLGVDAVKDGVVYHALAQVAVAVCLTHTLLDSLLKVAVHTDLVAVLDKEHRHSRVLTERYLLRGCDFVVFNNLVEDISAHGRRFLIARFGERVHDVAADIVVAVHKELLHGGGDLLRRDGTEFHNIILSMTHNYTFYIIKYFSGYFNTNKFMI